MTITIRGLIRTHQVGNCVRLDVGRHYRVFIIYNFEGICCRVSAVRDRKERGCIMLKQHPQFTTDASSVIFCSINRGLEGRHRLLYVFIVQDRCERDSLSLDCSCAACILKVDREFIIGSYSRTRRVCGPLEVQLFGAEKHLPIGEVRDSVHDAQVGTDNAIGLRHGIGHVDVVRCSEHLPGCRVAICRRNSEHRQRYELLGVLEEIKCRRGDRPVGRVYGDGLVSAGRSEDGNFAQMTAVDAT